MSDNASRSIDSLVEMRNAAKTLFTPGPASLVTENLTGLRPCFGRNDPDYAGIENTVLDSLKKMSGHREIARLQGSASLALEIMAMNFLHGDVLIIETGFYSQRLFQLAESAGRRTGSVRSVTRVDWSQLDNTHGRYDWVWACPTETSVGLTLPITTLAQLAHLVGARLALDATASIGLESDHGLADVVGYSSCKGLFGLTGASFVAFNELPEQQVDSFYLNLQTHLEKRMTGPYHAIASLADVLPRHFDIRESVVINKERCLTDFRAWTTRPSVNQPLLCTQLSQPLRAADPRVILYESRDPNAGTVVCHLGEAHLGRNAKGDILEKLKIVAQ